MGGIQEAHGGDTDAQQEVLAKARIPWDCKGPMPEDPANPNQTWKGHLSPSCDCGVHRHALRNLWIAVITAETRLRKRSEIFAVFTASAWVGFRTKVASWLGPLGQLKRKKGENVRAVEERAQKPLLPHQAPKGLLPDEEHERRLVLH